MLLYRHKVVIRNRFQNHADDMQRCSFAALLDVENLAKTLRISAFLKQKQKKIFI